MRLYITTIRGQCRKRLAALMAAAVLLSAQRSALPSGRELVQRHVAAIGGEAAFKMVTSLRLRGRMEMAAQNISADFDPSQFFSKNE